METKAHQKPSYAPLEKERGNSSSLKNVSKIHTHIPDIPANRNVNTIIGQEFCIRVFITTSLALALKILTFIMNEYPGDTISSSNIKGGPFSSVCSVSAVLTGREMGNAICACLSSMDRTKLSVSLNRVI